jgi:transketolase
MTTLSTTEQQPLAPELTWTDLDRLAVDTVRVLAADAVEKVGNGHPGTPAPP